MSFLHSMPYPMFQCHRNSMKHIINVSRYADRSHLVRSIRGQEHCYYAVYCISHADCVLLNGRRHTLVSRDNNFVECAHSLKVPSVSEGMAVVWKAMVVSMAIREHMAFRCAVCMLATTLPILCQGEQEMRILWHEMSLLMNTQAWESIHAVGWVPIIDSLTWK